MSGEELKQIEKGITPEISFDAMKFGTERDLRVALTELKWIKKTKGKVTKSDFEIVSEKYRFPTDFLKKGLRGFSFPEDYLISKSRWFPVLYSWTVHRHEHELNLFKFQFDYVQSLFRFSVILMFLGVVLSQLGFTLHNLLDLDWLQFLSAIILPFAFFFISLSAELRNSVADTKMKLDEYTAKLKEAGFYRIITANEKFIREHYRMVALAGGTLLKKMRASPSVSGIYIGTKEEEKPLQLSRLSRLLVRLHLLPKPSASVVKEKIPVFYAENPYIEYRKRIGELAEDQTIEEAT